MLGQFYLSICAVYTETLMNVYTRSNERKIVTTNQIISDYTAHSYHVCRRTVHKFTIEKFCVTLSSYLLRYKDNWKFFVKRICLRFTNRAQYFQLW
jgi:hypothetical protein